MIPIVTFKIGTMHRIQMKACKDIMKIAFSLKCHYLKVLLTKIVLILFFKYLVILLN